MKENTRKRKSFRERLSKLLTEKPEAHKVAKRYEVMAHVLFKEYPNLFESASKEVILELLKDVVYIDRQIRLQTGGEDEEVKEILSQEKQIELGYEPNVHTIHD